MEEIIEQKVVNMWLYFNKIDRSFSHSCTVQQPAEYVTEYIEVEADDDLPLGWRYTLEEDDVTITTHEKISSTHSQNEYTLEQVRIFRNRLLAESDWTQINDSPLSSEKKVEWSSYRQTLRDITETLDISSITTVSDDIFPTKPI